jgi:hypothetical protein
VKNQHASKWSEYEEAKKTWDFLTPSSARMEQCDLFFVKNNDDAKSPSIKAHFQRVVSPSPLSSIATAHEKPMVIVIDKDIIDVIIGGMYYSSPLHVMQADHRDEGKAVLLLIMAIPLPVLAVQRSMRQYKPTA